MFKKRKIYVYIFISIMFIVNMGYAQYYRYYFHGDTRNLSIYGLNLENGSVDEVIPNLGRALQFFITPDQSRCIIEDRGRVYAVEFTNIYEKYDLYYRQSPYDCVLHIIDSPKLNKLYLMIGDIEKNPKMTIIYNRMTYDMLDTLYNLYSLNNMPFLSSDEMKFFKLIPYSEGINFKSYKNDGDLINENLQIGDFGPFNETTTFLDDSKMGFGLVSFEPMRGFEYLHYIICHPEELSHYEPIHFPWRSKAYLSSDVKNIIIEEVQFIDDDDYNTQPEYRPGNVYVFNAQTGKLKQRLKLPPEGEILLFNTHPDQIFYYRPDAPHEPISVDLIQAQPDIDLIDMLISDVNTAYENSWIDNQGIANSLDQKLENVKKQLEKGKIKQAINMLNAFLNEVEAQKDKHLTSEAYALLKYNAEYLIQRLEED